SRLGYQDPNNFSHRFKKYYGLSPKQYRASNLG
ncbi:helix-turn-helix domain-containing protein, partial [Vibrio campbellii]